MTRPIMAAATLLAALLLRAAAGTAAEPDCLDCHSKQTPAAVRQWQASAHARAGVGCAACHGTDHGLIVKGQAPVGTARCGACHPKALAEHSASRHGMGLHSGWGCTRSQAGRDSRECAFCHEQGSTRPLSTVHCARFLKQSDAMTAIGCNRCHQIESSCAACHTSHATDLAIVRNPNVCATCHMGPDHPQWEMWQTSRHGTLSLSGGPQLGPGCQTCHMPAGSHDVSRGLTISSGMSPFPPEAAAKGRSEMLTVCSGCHAPAMARRELERADAVRVQSQALVDEAERIIRDLADARLLDPMPDQRPPHPLSGAALVLDAQMLYEDISPIERLFFKMKKYDLAKTVKGAYHQNPAYAHWYGNAEVKMDLVDIKGEAARLRGGKPRPSAPPGEAGQIGEDLEVVRRKLDRGALTPEGAARERRRLIDQLLAPGGR